MATDPLDELRTLYFKATKASIERDLGRAIALFKALPDEDARERAAGFMDGLSQLRSEWASGTSAAPGPDVPSAHQTPASGRRSRR